MLTFGGLSFAAPWVLIGLVTLPLIWWLLRFRPPAPTRIVFPPMVLLRRLTGRQESPVHIPPWLLALRYLVAVVFIGALAHPFVNAQTQLVGPGPLYLIVDDDWASAGRWQARRTAMINFIEQAAREDRSVILVLTALPPKTGKHETIKLMSPTDARSMVEGLVPKPWHADRANAIELLLEWSGKTTRQRGDVVWLSNSVNYSSSKTKASIEPLISRLKRLGSVLVMVDRVGRLPLLLRPPVTEGQALILRVDRPKVNFANSPASGLALRALDDNGQVLAHVPVVLQRGEQSAQAKLLLPSELRNRLTRVEVSGIQSAGTVVLVDERWRRRPVALVKAGSNIDQPLLDAHHYLRQALDPFTEVRTGGIPELLSRPLSMLILADAETPVQGEVELLKTWLEQGGVLVRFAGPNLARDDGMADPFLPVQLRRGNRVIGGSLSWGKPEILASFPKSSPFYGLAIPKDVHVRRQVLAEPSLDLAEKTWAQLSDGTPLVTAEQRGKGWLVLVHTTADGKWSDLAFSGVFVEMLRRLINVSRGVVVSGSNDYIPVASLDAFGKLGDPPTGILSIRASSLNAGKIGPSNPPGLYGHNRSLRALNLSQGLARIWAFGQFGKSVQRSEYSDLGGLDFRPWLLVFGMFLFLVDSVISFYMRGLFRLQIVVAVLAVVLAPAVAFSKDKDAYALANSLETRLAYVLTGSGRIDEISRAGLVGLNNILWRRTAAELGTPQGVDPKVDELSFFPVLYWPVITSAGIEDVTARRVRAYLRNGGVILFDTRGGTDNRRGDFGEFARQLALPQLLPIDADHVLGRSFYLIREFPGRWTGDTLWVEKAGERTNDGVSRVIVGNHDWASAWAMDAAQRPIFAVVPGGERQREMAFRFGINLVMYTLTGNYKADQVHLPAIIRRLGQ